VLTGGIERPDQTGQAELEAGPFGRGEGFEEMGVQRPEATAHPGRRRLPTSGQAQAVRPAVVRIPLPGQPLPPLEAGGEPTHGALLQAEPFGEILLGQLTDLGQLGQREHLR
jgi:hypothetical protein